MRSLNVLQISCLVFLLADLSGCDSVRDSQPVAESRVRMDTPVISDVDEPQSTCAVNEQSKRDLQRLFDSYLEFRDSPDFAEWGVSNNGPYDAWFKEVLSLRTKLHSSGQSDLSIAASDLMLLGMQNVPEELIDSKIAEIRSALNVD